MDSVKKLEINCTVGKVLKNYRVQHKLTQEKMAEQLGISVKYISRIENGNGGVKLETLVNYMNLLGIVPNILFQDLIKDSNAQLQIQLSDKISSLSKEKVEFLLEFIDLLADLNL